MDFGIGIVNKVLKRRTEVQGELGCFGLGDWWLRTFTSAEQARIEAVYQRPGQSTRKRPLTRGNRSSAYQTAAGLLTAVGITIHNFPEGVVVLAGAAESQKLAVLLAVAIAVHNIPEGIAVSVPILAATGNRMKAFLYSFLSGLAEPLGALLGAVILIHIMTPAVTAYTLAFVAGIMVFISFDELLPTAHRYGEEHAASLGVAAGMAVMIGTLVALS